MDTSQYLSMFLEESSDNLQLLNESLLILENDSEDIEILNQIFRVAHTIKGMAATMGYTRMAELTHKMEDVLSKFRNGEIKVTHEVVTVLFSCLDVLEAMVTDISDGGEGNLQVDHIITELVNIANGQCVDGRNIEAEVPESVGAVKITSDFVNEDKEKELESFNLNINEYDLDILKEAKINNFNAYHIHVELDEKTILKSARAFILFQTLEEYGEIIKSNPNLEDLESENFDFEIDLIFITQQQLNFISNAVTNISEMRDVIVNDISGLVAKENETKINKFIEKDENDVIDEVAVTSSGAEKLQSVEIKEKEVLESNTQKVSSRKVVDVNDMSKTTNSMASQVDSKKHNQETNVKTTTKQKNKGVGQSVRVDLERLDNFMNMVSELVIHRTRLEQITANHKIVELNETLEQVARTTTDLQELVMKIRMLPLDVVFNRFPRMIRDLSMELDKEIDFEVKGQDTELDRTVIEEIGEPLIHLLRNAADHGVESREKRIAQGKDPVGKIKLTAYSEGTKAVIKVSDDGNGIDVERVKAKAEKMGINTEGMVDSDVKNLIFAQGFSTNEVVTDISGRGVGMDVVKTKISSLGGTVDVISETGKGTTFIIKLPLTLQIIQSLLVKVGTETMAISLGFIDRVMEYDEKQIKKTNNKEIVVYNDKVFKLVRINDKLGIESENYGKKYIILAKVGEKEFALVVDSLLGQKEIVIKSFGNILKSTKEYIGATILGDGLVTLILDVAALI
ncbi:MAG: chemotaxis protein CheA [Clostridium sp.]|uniref:chemotaxis protein CheA n=1 Tax=Clostridium sp. TaxID=1506 RepID=UPI003065496D